jgi:hypothetical protein
MKEIGGYIELDSYHLPMLHEDAVALNCGRNALAYLFKSRKIKKLKVPYFICNSIINVCEREGVEKSYYHIGMDFKPIDLTLSNDEWLYLVNFYGQLSNDEIKRYVDKYKRVIVDQANGYFEDPLPGIDTFYTCRKWFGVADGALLYTDKLLDDEFPQDESFNRMHFLLGRYERTANEFYGEYNDNNKFFISEPIKKMSKLTWNLLHAIDYDRIKEIRLKNFEYLSGKLGNLNRLKLSNATFMYPLLVENGSEIRKRLQTNKIYIPTLWPAVFELTSTEDLENDMASNILPLPIDQRYCIDDMQYMVEAIKRYGEL